MVINQAKHLAKNALNLMLAIFQVLQLQKQEQTLLLQNIQTNHKTYFDL